MALAQMILRFFVRKGGDDGLAAAERALALDANLAEAHAVKAGSWPTPVVMMRRPPKSTSPCTWTPSPTRSTDQAGKLSYRQHRLEDAIRYYEKATTLMESDINSPCHAAQLLHRRRKSRGWLRAARLTLARSEKALAQDPNNGAVMGYSAYALVALGEAERAKERMNRAVLIDPDDWNMRYNFACVLLIHLNEIDAALELLGPVFEKMTVGFLNHAKADPDLVVLRDHPRFQAMIAAAEARLAV